MNIGNIWNIGKIGTFWNLRYRDYTECKERKKYWDKQKMKRLGNVGNIKRKRFKILLFWKTGNFGKVRIVCKMWNT